MTDTAGGKALPVPTAAPIHAERSGGQRAFCSRAVASKVKSSPTTKLNHIAASRRFFFDGAALFS